MAEELRDGGNGIFTDWWTDDRLNSRADDRDRCERSTYTYVYAADPLPYFA